MKQLKVLYLRINRNCALKGRCEYNVTLNQSIFLRIFPGYGLMGQRKKQVCRIIERAASRLAIKVGLVRPRCYRFHCIVDDGGFYYNVSVINNRGD